MGCNLSNSVGNEYLNGDSIATFSKLRISPASVEKLRKIFNKIDADGSGEIDYNEFIHHFGFKRSRFTKRAFSVMDEDGSGEVDFTEFVLCVWNYCTFNKPALMRFAFELYDEDGSGLIDADELLLMLKELYGKSKYKKNPKAQNVYKKILSQFTNESSGACEITFIDFRNFCIKYPAMLYPAFTVQLNFQNAILGRSYWEAEAKKRRQIEIQVANNTSNLDHDGNGGLGFQNLMQYLNGMDSANAGESLNNSLLGDDNLTKSTVEEEGQYRKSKTSKSGKKLPITNPCNSKKFVQNEYGNNTSQAWICKTCGRSNNIAKTRCATCKTKKVFSTR
jgi:Ca2+-binding EF-hand superfamily protein